MMSLEPVDKLIYVGVAERAICALDTRDGSQIWRQALESVPSFPSATEAAVYATTIAGAIHAWRRGDGAPLWVQRLVAEFPSPVAYADGRVCVGTSNGELHAFDAESGVFAWRQTIRDLMPAQAVAGAGCVYVCTRTGSVAAFRAMDGNRQWQVSLIAGDGILSLAVTSSVLIARSHNGQLVALRADDGDELWRHRDGYGGLSNPTVDDERVYVTGQRGAGVGWATVQAVQLRDGVVAWEVQPGTAVLSTSEIVDGHLYVAAAGMGREFAVHAYDAADGREIWRWRMMSAEGGITRPAATVEAVYVGVGRSDGLYALQAADGHLLWHALQGTSASAVNVR